MNQAEEDELIKDALDRVGTAYITHDAVRLAIRAAVAHERERCANAVFDLSDGQYQEIAAAIRRGP